MGGKDEEVHVRVGGGEGFAAEDAVEDGGGRERAAEVGLLGAVADDVPGGVEAAGLESVVDDGEEGDVFLDGKAADVAEDELPVGGSGGWPGTAGGGEQGGVDAALHEIAGAAGGLFEQGAELGIGGEEDLGEAVEAGGGGEGGGLGAAGERVSGTSGQPAGDGVEAAGGVLVDVGVPGGGEREAEAPGEAGAEDAELGGAGDVDEVGLEAAEGAGDAAGVAEEEGVEGEVALERDAEAGAGEVESLEGAFGSFGDGLAGADDEEGESAAVGEAGEVAGGVGDAVDLVEGVGEEGYAWGCGWGVGQGLLPFFCGLGARVGCRLRQFWVSWCGEVRRGRGQMQMQMRGSYARSG